MRRWLGWTLSGLGLFLALVLFMAPAELVAALVARGPLQLNAPAGSLWSGSGGLRADHQELGALRWQFVPRGLLRGHIALDVQLDGPSVHLAGRLEIGVLSWSVADMNGVVGNALLTRAASHYDVALQGDLTLRTFSISATRAGLDQANGTLAWPGGHVAYVLNGQSYAADTGPLRGRVSTWGNRLRLDVEAPPMNSRALRFTLGVDGWGSAAVTRQFMASVGFPWQGNAAPTEFVLEVEEKLF